jgi:hypothetical protein
MAHVVVAEEEGAHRHVFTIVLEGEGHQVTAPRDFWGVLAVLRSTLHPVVVVYSRDWYLGHLPERNEWIQALEANRTELRRHRYVSIGWKPGALLSWLGALEDELEVDVLQYPIRLEEMIAAVARAAEQMAQ